MSLKRFFAYSVAAHILIIAAMILFIPPVKEKKTGGEIFTHLVSPEEFLPQKQIPLPVPKVRPMPRIPRSLPGVNAPAPARRKSKMIRTEKQTFQEISRLQGYTKSNKNNTSESFIPSPETMGPEGGLKGRQGGLSGEPKIVPRGGNLPESENAGPSLREKLFDRNIITDLAKREIEKEEKEKKGKAFTFDEKEYRFLIYNRRLKERIESIWQYPPDAAAKGIYGDLIIRFTIKKNGKLGAVEILRTSGHKNLDDAAIKALNDGEPYWPLPEEWGMEAYTIEGHFIYTIYGYHIM